MESQYQSTPGEAFLGFLLAFCFVAFCTMFYLWYTERAKNRKAARRATQELLAGFGGADGRKFLTALKGKAGTVNRPDLVHDWDTVIGMVRLLLEIAEPYSDLLGTVRRTLREFLPVQSADTTN
jgi:hypothetical protein